MSAVLCNLQGSPPVRRRKRPGHGTLSKRRRVGAKGKGTDSLDRAGDSLVMPYLSQFPLPADGADLRSDEVLRFMKIASYRFIAGYSPFHLITLRPQVLCFIEIKFL